MEAGTDYFNQKLYEALQGRINEKYDDKTARKVTHAVHNCLVDALVADDNEILPDSLLVSDLNAESIDGLDIAFRLKYSLDIRFSKEGEQPLALAMLYRDGVMKASKEKTALDLAVEAYQLAMNR